VFTPEDRFWAKVMGGDFRDCWAWTAAIKQSSGYGAFQVGGKTRYAHRVAYEFMIGPIPDGLELDHLCGQRACVNPWHLEPVTGLVNSRRGRQTRATDTHCANGHEWTAETIMFRGGYRKCRECYLITQFHMRVARHRRERAAARQSVAA
jgi:hypothetical protein